MATYTQMVEKIRDWANRDDNVLSSAVIKDCINYAVDSAYRDLRIVPLEYTTRYTVSNPADGENTLAIPQDAIEFIQLNRVDGTDYIPYSAKIDIRSFREVVDAISGGDYVDRRKAPRRQDGPRFWTRDRGSLLLYPDLNDGDIFELYYYRRLPEVDARYVINAANAEAGLLSLASTLTDNDNDADPEITTLTLTAGETLSDAIIAASDFTDGQEIVGNLTPNWLRDDNEKVVLFGALMEVFDYLDETEMRQKYATKFEQEIQKLNMEDNKRMPSGGTTTLVYGSSLL